MARAVARLATLLYAVAAAAYLLDRITKLLVEDRLAGRPPVQVIPGVLDLNYTTNSGGAFGLGRSAPLVFAAATVLVAIAIGIASLRLSRPSAAIALGLVLGGALGNLTDRLFRAPGFLRGEVVDFVRIGAFPSFNVADSAVTIGAVLLLLWGWRDRDERRDPG